MAEAVSVNLTGPALAFLLYENVKVKYDQEGFLLGSTSEIVTKTITDSSSQNIKSQKIINVNAVVPCPNNGFFYNNLGEISVEKINLLLGPDIKNVVGWYHYRFDHALECTLREKIVHLELTKSGLFSIPDNLFSCCLLTYVTSAIESNHTYKHSFVRYCDDSDCFVVVPLHISNLGESYSCYKFATQSSSIINIPKTKHFDLCLIDQIQDQLHNDTVKTTKELSKSESIKQKLWEEIEILKNKIEYYEILLEEKAMMDAKEKEEQEKLELLQQQIELQDEIADNSNNEEQDNCNLKHENMAQVMVTDHCIGILDDKSSEKNSEENLIDFNDDITSEPPKRKTYAEISAAQHIKN